MKVHVDFSAVTQKPPTEAQIKFAGLISEALDVQFPTNSFEYTFECFRDFISAHIEEYRDSQWGGDCWGDEEWLNWVGISVYDLLDFQ